MVARFVCGLTLAALMSFMGLGLGCSSTASEEMASPGAVGICTSCGQIEGTDLCCDPDQPLCGGCSLQKGSIGCCKIEAGSDEKVAVCTKCGYFKGTDQCCQGGETCSKCNLVKGSPGCCKL